MKVMYRFCQRLVVFCLLTTITACSTPTKPPTQPEPGKSITATEAYELVNKDGKNILFIDVRTPAEVAQRMPKRADGNVPYILRKWNTNHTKFERVLNKNFVPGIEARLKKKGLDKQNTVILICSEGRRSTKAAKALAKIGYKNVYSIKNGIADWWTEELMED
jgi:rhodanese-related sulfurtransferase